MTELISTQYLALGLAFATIVMVVGAIGYMFIDETPKIQQRLRAIQSGSVVTDANEHAEGAFAVRWTKPVSKLLLPEEGWRDSHYRKRLILGGYRSESAVYLFASGKIIGAIALPALLLLVTSITGTNLFADLKGVVFTVATAVIGFYLPDMILSSKTKDRQRLLDEQLPDAVDLIVICIEAGLGLTSAILRVGTELATSHKEMSEELILVNLEVKAGRTKEEALSSFAERTGIDSIKALTSILIQAEQFGTSIAASLSRHADDLRVQRIQNAREQAAKLPVKMTFPVVIFIFPALFLILLGPAGMQMIEGFSTILPK